MYLHLHGTVLGPLPYLHLCKHRTGVKARRFRRANDVDARNIRANCRLLILVWTRLVDNGAHLLNRGLVRSVRVRVDALVWRKYKPGNERNATWQCLCNVCMYVHAFLCAANHDPPHVAIWLGNTLLSSVHNGLAFPSPFAWTISKSELFRVWLIFKQIFNPRRKPHSKQAQGKQPTRWSKQRTSELKVLKLTASGDPAYIGLCGQCEWRF